MLPEKQSFCLDIATRAHCGTYEYIMYVFFIDQVAYIHQQSTFSRPRHIQYHYIPLATTISSPSRQKRHLARSAHTAPIPLILNEHEYRISTRSRLRVCVCVFGMLSLSLYLAMCGGPWPIRAWRCWPAEPINWRWTCETRRCWSLMPISCRLDCLCGCPGGIIYYPQVAAKNGATHNEEI